MFEFQICKQPICFLILNWVLVFVNVCLLIIICYFQFPGDYCFTNWVIMSCAPCVDPCSSVSKDDLDRWTNSLKHVLANQTATKMFEIYLQACKLDSADILELWKKCDGLLRYVHHKNIEKWACHESIRLVGCLYYNQWRLRYSYQLGGGRVKSIWHLSV